jgi:hypothetical protein
MGQDNFSLKEQRADEQKSSIFYPLSSTNPDVPAALRAKGTYSWFMMPVIAQAWDKHLKSLGLVLKVTDQTSPPTAVVFIVDEKPTMIPAQKWDEYPGGGLFTSIEREDIVRSIATARKVTVTVFGNSPLSATYTSGDLSLFRSVVTMYDSATFNISQPSVVNPATDSVTQPASAPITSTAAPSTPSASLSRIIPSARSSRTEYLQSKVSEATAMCREQIIATAKDPSSVKFDDNPSYVLENGHKDWISIMWGIMGRNTYGAVLRHSMTCFVSCKAGSACTMMGVYE